MRQVSPKVRKNDAIHKQHVIIFSPLSVSPPWVSSVFQKNNQIILQVGLNTYPSPPPFILNRMRVAYRLLPIRASSPIYIWGCELSTSHTHTHITCTHQHFYYYYNDHQRCQYICIFTTLQRYYSNYIFLRLSPRRGQKKKNPMHTLRTVLVAPPPHGLAGCVMLTIYLFFPPLSFLV